MEEKASEYEGTSENNFDVLSFERKLIETVEELRLKRNLEIENEKALKFLMQEKHQTELEWDERQRRHSQEKSELEQQISLLSRKLEEKHHGLDEERIKQQVVNKTYSEEIRQLKEELRNANSEKFAFVKRVQEIEGQLNLKNNFQESIMDKITDMKKRSKTVSDECQKLSISQTKMLENVSDVKSYIRNIEIRVEHVQEVTAISEKKNEELKNELLSAKSEVTLLKNSSLPKKPKTDKFTDLRMLNEKYSEFEKIFASTQKEKEKILNNFLESNRLLCEALNKYADAQETEKVLNAKVEKYENEVVKLKRKEEDLLEELAKNKEDNDFTKDKRTLDAECKGTQTLSDVVIDSCLENDIVETTILEDVNNSSSMTNQIRQTECISTQICAARSNKSMLDSESLNKFKENESMPFGRFLKRKLSTMDDNEIETPPQKLFCSSNVIDQKEDWGIENQVHRMVQPLVEDEKSIPSSLNSLDVIGLSQEKQDNVGFSKSVNEDDPIEENGGFQVGEVETIDMKSVQQNLRELKVSDGGSFPASE